MTATAVFENDPSVGIRSESHKIELPFNDWADEDHKEEVRAELKKLYTWLDQEFECSYILFEGETY